MSELLQALALFTVLKPEADVPLITVAVRDELHPFQSNIAEPSHAMLGCWHPIKNRSTNILHKLWSQEAPRCLKPRAFKLHP